MIRVALVKHHMHKDNLWFIIGTHTTHPRYHPVFVEYHIILNYIQLQPMHHRIIVIARQNKGI